MRETRVFGRRKMATTRAPIIDLTMWCQALNPMLPPLSRKSIQRPPVLTPCDRQSNPPPLDRLHGTLSTRGSEKRS